MIHMLHRRASRRDEQHGLLVDAIEHLCEAHDWENAIFLVERLMQQQNYGDSKAQSLKRLQNLLMRLLRTLIRPRHLSYNEPRSLLKEMAIADSQGHHPPQLLLDPLSTREVEVLRLVACGSSNRKIANDLAIAPATVKRHVSNILSKLQAANRTQAVAYARHLGLFT